MTRDEDALEQSEVSSARMITLRHWLVNRNEPPAGKRPVEQRAASI